MKEKRTAVIIGGAVRLSLELPANWIDLRLQAFDLNALLGERRESFLPEQREGHEAQVFENALRDLVTRAIEAGVVLAAAWAEATSMSEWLDGERPLLMAALSVSWSAVPGLSPALGPTVARRALLNVGSGVDALEEPSKVELPVGPAIRQASLRQLPLPDGSGPEASVVVDRFLLTSLPGGIVTLDFQTPNLALLDAFRPLFLGIAASVEVNT